MSITSTTRGGALHWNGNRGLGLIGCDGSRCQAVFDAIRRYHLSKGWRDVAYNHLRCPGCGRTFVGRDWGARSAANGTSAANREWHAWMVMYGGNEPLTLSAKRWLHEMNAEHRRRYGRSRLTTHRAVRGGTTECPGPEGLAWIAAGAPLPNQPDEEDDMPLTDADIAKIADAVHHRQIRTNNAGDTSRFEWTYSGLYRLLAREIPRLRAIEAALGAVVEADPSSSLTADDLRRIIAEEVVNVEVTVRAELDG